MTVNYLTFELSDMSDHQYDTAVLNMTDSRNI